MLLEEFVEGARLHNRDPVAQSDLLIKKLRAETPETIIDLYRQAMKSASEIHEKWQGRPEPQALFASQQVSNQTGPARDPFPGVPPLMGRFPERLPIDYDQWIRGWCLFQVLTGNVPVPEDHFAPRPDWPAFLEYFTGMTGIRSMPHDFQTAYERSSDIPWPFCPREEDPEFLIYLEQSEHAPHRVQLYRTAAREVAMDLNASAQWREWWLSGPLRSLEFGISETHALYPGATAMHTGDTPTYTRIKKLGLTVMGTLTPNLDRIVQTEEADIPRLILKDLTVLFHKVHTKYGFTKDLPQTE
jgi:hypothetical protein